MLLLDEPLGALDLKLREEMQVELKSIQHEVGITFVFVTHDQGEALSMSDRVAVFNQGRIEQVGTPREIYERPATTFVAGFVGTSNFIVGDLAQHLVGRRGVFSVRPEKITVLPVGTSAPDGYAEVSGTIRDFQYLGSECRMRVTLVDGSELVATVPSDGLAAVQVGESTTLTWPASAVFEVEELQLTGGENQ